MQISTIAAAFWTASSSVTSNFKTEKRFAALSLKALSVLFLPHTAAGQKSSEACEGSWFPGPGQDCLWKRPHFA